MIKILTRRQALAATGAAAMVGSLGMAGAARAAHQFNQPVSFVIPFGPGGTFDAYSREFSKLLTTSLNVNVEPINQPGGGGTMAIFDLFQAKPDGTTISLMDMPGILLRQKQLGQPVRNLTWVATLGRDAFGLAVGAKTQIKTLADLKALSAQRPITFAETGVDSAYVATRVFIAALGLRAKFVTGYKGSSDSSVAAGRGDVDAVVYALSTVRQMEKAGLLRPVFVFETASSLPGIEDAGSINQPDLGKFFAWRPVVAPPGMPAEIATTLSDALVTAAQSPDALAWSKKVHTTLHPLDQQGTMAMLAEQEALVRKYQADLKMTGNGA